MCILDELSKESLSADNILRYVDEYSIYSRYIGEELELGTRYSSPLRTSDDNPSFSLYQGRKGKLLFKDHATNYQGDVFEFVRILMGNGHSQEIPWHKVLRQIDHDFQIGLYSDESNSGSFTPIKIKTTPKIKEKYTIQVTSKQKLSQKYLNYWQQKYDITIETLDSYNVTDVAVIHYTSKSHTFQYYPKSLCIAYRIGGRYELYFPFESKKNGKFRNDLPENWIKGYLQLKHKNDFCIITKAMKEVIFFRQHFDWDAVAGKSETTMIPHHLMMNLITRFTRVYIWLDPDDAGRQSQEKYLKMYPTLIPVNYDTSIEQKDPTDRYEYLKSQGRKADALSEITNLINTWKK